MENQENNRARTAAQLGAAAVNIARGAAQGGVAGAAVEGVKSFAPQLIKVLTGILFFFFSLPLLIFVGIPSSMFGMPSVESADIRQMTDEAQIAADNYAGTQSNIQQHADYLLQQAAMGYDDVQVSRKLDGFDSYWMAAISSVLHVQELTEINKTEVRNIVNRVVRQTTQAETYMEEEEYVHINEDGTTEIRTREVERKRLIVSQRIATPEEVMAQLGFTNFERQWAYQIHDAIADNQEQDDTPSVDMGDVTFTDTETHVVYYSQIDSRWSDKAYSGSTIGIAGCGPTSVAIAVSTLTGRTITPDQVAEWSESTGHAAWSTSNRIASQSFGASCHSSISLGVAPFNSRLGFSSDIAMFCSFFSGSSIYKILAASCSAVVVFPHHFGPSISTAPLPSNFRIRISSAILFLYLFIRNTSFPFTVLILYLVTMNFTTVFR